MNAIILEDEPLNVAYLEKLLQNADSDIKVTHVLDTVAGGIEVLSGNHGADVLFCDIHLADGHSFEIFQNITVLTPVIFTTAFDEYAIRAFKVNSIDYLLKPVDPAELKAALEKLKRWEKSSNEFGDSIRRLLLEQQKTYKNRFLLKMGQQISSVKTDEIAFFIAENGLVMLHTINGKRFPVDVTMDQLEGMLNPKQFFRINRQVVLHIDQATKVHTWFNSRLKIDNPGLKDEAAIVSRERVNDFKSWLDQ